ncbi:tetratricopeptide repeat protein [Rhizobiaceae bacterium n13]|uniref:Ancillary SecYEG translocon subunit n=1 Tax=Ferirhizobium litorale TaxID=2927786 RepID=A0AAE3Q9R8_9HYPH|nr:tetratricopeptide repeat protein [Fererhizobium litorale]MDI7860802.1 tetratricopeptide repeat protein [Fererhizobium litorale]MDI7920950.1 tetratricopeptide repeat protein [Fererhizobium litorale]
MAFNDDSFIREVNEELRSERLQSVWKRYGRILIGIAVLIVLGTAAHRGYDYWMTQKASDTGDQFLAAMKLAQANKTDEALAALAAIETEGHGSYPVLARLRAAALEAQKGDSAKAIATFTAIGKDEAAPAAIRDAARMRAAWLLIENGTYEQVSAEVEQMAVPQNPLRHSAREALGLSAYKAGDFKRAREWFQQIVDDPEAPRNVANRAQMLLDLIAGSGKAP